MKKILITGSNGQLGQEIQAIKQNYNDLSFYFTDVEVLDITNFEKLEQFYNKNNFDLIINCAAYTAVDKAEQEEKLANLINETGVYNLRLIAEKHDLPFIHISTDYVFNGKNYKPYTERDDTSPESIYGKSKLAGEKSIIDYKKAIIIRTSWLYSVYGNNFVKTIIKISTENDSINVVFDQIGSPTNAADLAKAVLDIVVKLDNIDNYSGIYHYSDEGACSWYDFAIEIIKLKNISCNVVPVTSKEFVRPAKRPFYSVLDKSKIKNTFNVDVPHWASSLKTVIDKM